MIYQTKLLQNLIQCFAIYASKSVVWIKERQESFEEASSAELRKEKKALTKNQPYCLLQLAFA